MKETVNYQETFELLDIRSGTVIGCEHFKKSRNPSYKLVIDFGAEIGHKNSSAQITAHYTEESMVGRQVVAIINFPPRNIAGFMSEVLILGVYDENKEVILLKPERQLPNGSIIG